jgi:hypothetical protein
VAVVVRHHQEAQHLEEMAAEETVCIPAPVEMAQPILVAEVVVFGTQVLHQQAMAVLAS